MSLGFRKQSPDLLTPGPSNSSVLNPSLYKIMQKVAWGATQLQSKAQPISQDRIKPPLSLYLSISTSPSSIAMADTCNSRSLSWLAKTCLPDPRREISRPIPSPAPESHRRVAAGEASPILSLPDDLLLECLSRVPLSSLSMLPLVCRRFAALFDSPAFPTLRRARGRLRRTLLALSLPDPAFLLAASLPLCAGDDAAEPIASAVPFPSPAIAASFRLAAIGRAVYLIGRTATLRYDALTGALYPRAPTLLPRKKFAAAAVGGRIYVAGGSTSAAVEEYDPAADSWRIVAEAPRRRYGCVGAATADGVFYVAGGLLVGGGGGAGRFDAHVCAGSMDAYHVGTGAWARATRAAALPGGGCVVGAVGVGSHVYVLASHAVEVSFWRWEGGSKGGRRGGGGGEWTRLEPPPMPVLSGFGRGSAIRFSCAAVGEERVVAAAHVPGGGAGWEGAQGMVMVYDVAGGWWAQGPDLPSGLRRAALAAVEC